MKGYNRLLFRLMAVLLTAALTVPMDMPGARAAEAGRQAYLKMKLAARTGPGTWYDEPGSFFINDYKNTRVNVLSRAWDSRNSIWWLQVEFTWRGTPYRVYTGLKRVNINIDLVPEETVLGTSRTRRSSTAYWGPGTAYAASRYDVPSGRSVTVLDVENGYAQVEFYDARTADRDYARRRAWIPADNLEGSWDPGSGQTQPGGAPQSGAVYRDRNDHMNTLTVVTVQSSYIVFDCFWYRITSIDGVVARKDSSGRYVFDFEDGLARGYLTFSGRTATLRLTGSELPYIGPGTYTYER